MSTMKAMIVFAALMMSCEAQSADNRLCVNMQPICADEVLQFIALGTLYTAESGNAYGCLDSQPDPTWYYLRISDDSAANSNLYMDLTASADIDFIIYGPFATLDLAKAQCGSLGTGSPSNNQIEDCSYSSTNQQTPALQGVNPGEYYVMLVTNYAQQYQPVTLQYGVGNGGSIAQLLTDLCYCSDDPSAPGIQYVDGDYEGIGTCSCTAASNVGTRLDKLRFLYLPRTSDELIAPVDISVCFDTDCFVPIQTFSNVYIGDELEVDMANFNWQFFGTTTYFAISEAGVEVSFGSLPTGCVEDIIGFSLEGSQSITITGWKDAQSAAQCDDGYDPCTCYEGCFTYRYCTLDPGCFVNEETGKCEDFNDALQRSMSLTSTASTDCGMVPVCTEAGLGLSEPHYCTCQASCSGAYCNTIAFVEDRLGLGVTEDTDILCPDNLQPTCCCSCPNCDPYMQVVG